MIRAYIALAAVAAALAGLAWWGHGRYAEGYQAGAAEVRAEYAQRDAAAAEMQRELTKDRNRANQGIDREDNRRRFEALRAAAADRAAVDGLRDALAAVSREAGDSSTTTSCADERRAVSVLAGLVSEGAGLLAAGKASGTELATQAAGLREYVASVCLMPVMGSQ